MDAKTSRPRSAHGWTKIAKKLDIKSEAEELGVEFVSEMSSSKGYITCWAVDRPHGDSPSAGVNLESGWYKDHGGSGMGCYLYQLAHVMGRFPSADAALYYYAEKVDMVASLSDGIAHRQTSLQSVEECEWSGPKEIVFLRRYPGVTKTALHLAGAKFGKWPKKSPDPNDVLIFKGYDRNMDHTGYVLQSVWPRGICKYNGPNKPTSMENRLVIGSSGMVNDHAIDLVTREDKQPRLIIKTEGISDMLRLQSAVPESLIDEIVVWTNACGTKDVPAHCLNLFRGYPTVILHDWDVPGQEGANKWCVDLAPFVPSIKNIVLYPDDIQEKKGKDVRDWLDEGHSFDELLALIDRTEAFSVQEEELTPAQILRRTLGPDASEVDIEGHQLLVNLGVLVLGMEETTGSIVCYSEKTGRRFSIKDISRYKYENALLDMGKEIMEYVSAGSSDYEPTKVSMYQLRQTFARRAAECVINDKDTKGAGIWELGGRCVLVNDTDVSIANGTMTQSRVPSISGTLIEFAHEKWFDHNEMSEFYERSADLNWCSQTFNKCIEIFGRWDNWRYPDCPMIITSMICCTWVQSVFDFRPGVVVTGSTNTGKTMLMQECVSKFFGKQVHMMTNISEAWVRQTIGNTSSVLMVDEFERSRYRQEIFNLLRSSTRGTSMGRGTISQKGMTFQMRHIVWLSSIETGLNDAADRNRFIIMPLEKLPSGHGNTLQVPDPGECEELGKKLMAIGMRYFRSFKSMWAQLKETAIEGVDRRLIEAYALPVAVLATIRSVNVESARDLLRDTVLRRLDYTASEGESDEEDLLADIATIQKSVKGTTYTVGQLITAPSFEFADLYGQPTTPERELETLGMKLCSLEGGKGVVGNDGVAIVPSVVRRFLRDSRFQNMQVKEILIRCSGAHQRRLTIAGSQHRCIVVPLKALLNTEGDPETAGHMFDS